MNIAGQPLGLAQVAPLKSGQDRAGRSGYPVQSFGINALLSPYEIRYYARAGAIGTVVGTLERKGVHFLLFDRKPLSDE